jgi:hypothetical protein
MLSSLVHLLRQRLPGMFQFRTFSMAIETAAFAARYEMDVKQSLTCTVVGHEHGRQAQKNNTDLC